MWPRYGRRALTTELNNRLTRRGLLGQAGAAVLAMPLAAEVMRASAAEGVKLSDKTEVPDNPLGTDRKVRVGIVGGGFGTSFQYHEHPNCIVHAVSDLRTDRRDALMKTYRCAKSYESLEKMLEDKEIEAIALYTEAPNHAKHALEILKAGKHVGSAVPAATSLEDCEKLLEAKKRTGLKYMMFETSYYRYFTIAARELFRQGKFGELFYSEVEYYHPKNESFVKKYYYHEGKRTWRYGLPPMLYPTHSNGFLVGVTGERLVEVSCLGWGDPNDSSLKDNVYQNRMNAASALCKTDKGHICRSNVFWTGTEEGERAQWIGTDLSFFMPSSSGQPFRMRGTNAPEWTEVPKYWERLPKPLRHDSGHGGSHPFITHEFIAALVENREPAIDIHESLAMTAPGIVADASARKGGEQMKVPSFDSPHSGANDQ